MMDVLFLCGCPWACVDFVSGAERIERLTIDLKRCGCCLWHDTERMFSFKREKSQQHWRQKEWSKTQTQSKIKSITKNCYDIRRGGPPHTRLRCTVTPFWNFASFFLLPPFSFPLWLAVCQHAKPGFNDSHWRRCTRAQGEMTVTNVIAIGEQCFSYRTIFTLTRSPI